MSVAEKFTPEVETHRFFLPDFSELGVWLIGRLKQKHPTMTDAGLMSWLRSLIQSQDYLFIRRGSAVLLAQQIREGVDAGIIVKVLFSFCQSGNEQDGAYLFDDLHRWATGLGAREVMIGDNNDISQTLIEEVLGKIQKRTVLYWKPQR